MAELKTKPTSASARAYLDSIADPVRRRDCTALLEMMAEISGEPPKMWGSSIVGFGTYRYRYASGRTGTWFRVGFASRKGALTLYLMLDLDSQAKRLVALGKYKRGKGCLYVKRLSDVSEDVLRDLISASCRQGQEASCGGS